MIYEVCSGRYFIVDRDVQCKFYRRGYFGSIDDFRDSGFEEVNLSFGNNPNVTLTLTLPVSRFRRVVAAFRIRVEEYSEAFFFFLNI